LKIFQQLKILFIFLCVLPTAVLATISSEIKQLNTMNKLRIATFNVSMEALNYIDQSTNKHYQVHGDELMQALMNKHQQIENIAEIIQRVNPDILLLNEFDHQNESHKALKFFISRYLEISQQEQSPIIFPYFYQGSVNTGVATPFDLNNDNKQGTSPADNYGFGYFPGHFGMALLSKYPLDLTNIRTFQTFKWKDMPNALQPFDPIKGKKWYSEQAWDNLRLSSKSHWDIPVVIDKHRIHILASHPTPPVFDGPENRNGNRNHDEIRFWHDYISPNHADYIYDDKHNFGGLPNNEPFIILGDLNASTVDGDANIKGISSLLNHPNVQDPKPRSLGSQFNDKNNKHSPEHTASWGMRADYVLPSTQNFTIQNSGVFWPLATDSTFRLVKDRAASSDHRLVWVDLLIN
jgi:endonuclease/exonuclease/phosphatase family metal-dependent hydrolase